VKRDYALFEKLSEGSELWRRQDHRLLDAQRELVEISKTTENDFAMHLRRTAIRHIGNSTTDWRDYITQKN